MLGLNYYVTSDRYLDDRLDLYPSELRGGDSGDEPLVDIEALRVRPEGISGVGRVLTEAWERYHLPVAVTEAHLGDSSDNQIRWLTEIWNDSCAARDAGVDVRAVTVWALLGSWNWCSLCTRDLADTSRAPSTFRPAPPSDTAGGVRSAAGAKWAYRRPRPA